MEGVEEGEGHDIGEYVGEGRFRIGDCEGVEVDHRVGIEEV